jgi:hypothetical protein
VHAPGVARRGVARQEAAKPVSSRHYVLHGLCAQRDSSGQQGQHAARPQRRTCSCCPAARSCPSVVRLTTPSGEISSTVWTHDGDNGACASVRMCAVRVAPPSGIAAAAFAGHGASKHAPVSGSPI